jgi:hypothetical protein
MGTNAPSNEGGKPLLSDLRALYDRHRFLDAWQAGAALWEPSTDNDSRTLRNNPPIGNNNLGRYLLSHLSPMGARWFISSHQSKSLAAEARILDHGLHISNRWYRVHLAHLQPAATGGHFGPHALGLLVWAAGGAG